MKPIALCLILLTGCATVSYSPYVGKNEGWPLASGAFVKTVRNVQLYRGFPSQPYKVLGVLNVGNIGAEGYESQLAWAVKAHGGDAAIIIGPNVAGQGAAIINGTSTTYQMGQISQTYSNPSFAVPISVYELTAYIIKFDSPSTKTP
jgi:hypothetical protein